MKKNIVIFDDSDYSLDEYDEVFMGADVEILKIQHPFLHEVIGVFEKFKPDLIIVDLVMGGDANEGYGLIPSIKENDLIKEVPVVVCSKLINDSQSGMKNALNCKRLSVVGVYGKLPTLPTAIMFLNHTK